MSESLPITNPFRENKKIESILIESLQLCDSSKF